MTVCPKVAASLQSIQSRLGDDLGGVLEEQPAAPAANFRQTMVLEHLSGFQAGGAMPLAPGSYRFGRSSSSTMLDNGKTQDPQFGLTVDPAGSVMLYPPTTGVVLDGEMISEPSPMSVGQIITVGHNRFGLRPQERLAVSRTSTAGEAGEAMPTPTKGRGIDQAVIEWVRSHRDRTLRSLWSGQVSPVEAHRRVTENNLFRTGADDDGFGRLFLGTADVRYVPPPEFDTANRSTRDHVEALFPTLPGAPINVDLKETSLAIVGTGEHARAVATWLMFSLAVQCSPEDLAMVAQTSDHTGSWGWLDRLPHFDSASPALRVVLVDENWPGGQVPNGVIALFDPSAIVPREFGATLDVTLDSAVFTNHLTGTTYPEVNVIGLANAVAVERSLLMSQHLAAEVDR